MEKKLMFSLGTVLLLAVGAGFYIYRGESGVQPVEIVATSTLKASSTAVQIGKAKMAVDIADTPALRERGLSGRPELEEGTGMLFVFEKPAFYGFWMKDMQFPIDIIWINEEKKVIGVSEGLEPGSYPEIYYPREMILYALEVPAGFVSENNIKEGDEFKLVSQN